MLIPGYLRSFEKEVEKAKKRGLDLAALKEAMKKLIEETPLGPKHTNHKMKGNFLDIGNGTLHQFGYLCTRRIKSASFLLGLGLIPTCSKS